MPPLTTEQNEAMDLLHEIGEEICLFAPFEPGDFGPMLNAVGNGSGRQTTPDAIPAPDLPEDRALTDVRCGQPCVEGPHGAVLGEVRVKHRDFLAPPLLVRLAANDEELW